MTSAIPRLSRVTIAIAAMPAVALAAALFTAAPALAGGYLKLGDIKGESTDKGHSDQIEVLSWSFGASQAGADLESNAAPSRSAKSKGKGEGKVEYTWKVEEGVKGDPAPGEAEITLNADAARAGVRTGKRKTGDITLKRGLTGGSEAAGGFSGRIRVASGDVNNAADSASGLPTGKRQHKPLTVTKPVDKAAGSVTMVVPAGMCTVGARYPTAELGTGEEVYRMHDVVVTGCAAASGGERPTETLSLNFTRIE